MKRLKPFKKKLDTKRAARKQRVPARVQRILMISAIVSAVLLLVFVEIVRPNQDAKSYTSRLEAASVPLENCFEDLAKTTDLKIFYAPDVSSQTKASETATILRQIDHCRKELKNFDKASNQLLALRFAGYTPTYREARVNQRQAFDIVGQSNDVLDQYQAMGAFLADYYRHIDAFQTYTTTLTSDQTYFGATRVKTLRDQANDLRARSVYIQQLDAPAEFEPTKNATSSMFAQAADGFDKLAEGYTYTNDYLISAGYASVDQAVTSYDTTVINLPFDQLVNSYIPKQVMQLPGKVDNLLATATE